MCGLPRVTQANSICGQPNRCQGTSSPNKHAKWSIVKQRWLQSTNATFIAVFGFKFNVNKTTHQFTQWHKILKKDIGAGLISAHACIWVMNSCVMARGIVQIKIQILCIVWLLMFMKCYMEKSTIRLNVLGSVHDNHHCISRRAQNILSSIHNSGIKNIPIVTSIKEQSGSFKRPLLRNSHECHKCEDGCRWQYQQIWRILKSWSVILALSLEVYYCIIESWGMFSQV